MNKPVKPDGPADPTVEDARVGYQAAIDLWIYQGELNWNRFNVMMVASSILLGVLGTVLASQRPLPFLTIPLAAVGLALCVVWALLMERGFDYHQYWGACAWELEKQYLGDTVQVVSNLQHLTQGRQVRFDEIGQAHAFRRSSKVSQRKVARFVIGVFAVVFVLSITYDVLVLVRVL